MGDKDINELFGNAELLIGTTDGGLKPLGTIVQRSASFEAEDNEPITYPINGKSSFSFSVERTPELDALMKAPPEVEQAQSMLERLQNYHAVWQNMYGCGQRKKRRLIERDIRSLYARLKKHCQIYGIEIKQKQD